MSNKKVLFVDDEISILRLVGDALEDEGYDVVSAHSGVQALELLRQGGDFDLIISDVSMPDGVSGVDLAHAARDLKSLAKIILVSGHPKAELGEFPPEVAYLAKPYRLAQLMSVIDGGT